VMRFGKAKSLIGYRFSRAMQSHLVHQPKNSLRQSTLPDSIKSDRNYMRASRFRNAQIRLHRSDGGRPRTDCEAKRATLFRSRTILPALFICLSFTSHPIIDKSFWTLSTKHLANHTFSKLYRVASSRTGDFHGFPIRLSITSHLSVTYRNAT
jgi:hypothetical protein